MKFSIPKILLLIDCSTMCKYQWEIRWHSWEYACSRTFHSVIIQCVSSFFLSNLDKGVIFYSLLLTSFASCNTWNCSKSISGNIERKSWWNFELKYFSAVRRASTNITSNLHPNCFSTLENPFCYAFNLLKSGRIKVCSHFWRMPKMLTMIRDSWGFESHWTVRKFHLDYRWECL